MVDFGELFMEEESHVIKYKDKILHLIDEFPISNGDKLLISIKHTKSNYIQGISVGIYGSCEIAGEINKKGKYLNMLFWEDAELINPKNIELTIYTKKDFVCIQNMWETSYSYLVSDSLGNPVTKTKKRMDKGHNGAAMIVEEIENGRIYHCNDGYPDEDFDDIIFTVQRVGNVFEAKKK